MQAGAQMVKLECAEWAVDTVRFLTERGVPVCAHLGFTPQTVSGAGRLQGAGPRRGRRTRQGAGPGHGGCRRADAAVRDGAGSSWRARSRRKVPVPVIGIGAGGGTSGQVLVLHDMLDVTPGPQAAFRQELHERFGDSVAGAIRRYVSRGQVRGLSRRGRARLPVNESWSTRSPNCAQLVGAGRAAFVPTMGNLHAKAIWRWSPRRGRWPPTRRWW